MVSPFFSARELPRFVSEVRRTFTPDEIAAHLAQIERAQAEEDVESRIRAVDAIRDPDPQREQKRRDEVKPWLAAR
jgi:hypothetical protein